MRLAAWSVGAKRAGAGAGFAAQADLAVAFVERSTQLLAPNGTLALLVPAKLWRALAGGGIRQLLAEQTRIHTVRDWSDAPSLFAAATYPSLIVAQRIAVRAPIPTPRIHVAIARHNTTHEFSLPIQHLTLDNDPAAPWILLPPHVRTAFEKLRRTAPPLGDSPLGRPQLGTKCGCNAAFLVHATEHDDELATITANARSALIERQMLRPALRGEAIQSLAAQTSQQVGSGDLRIIWTHDNNGTPLRTLPPHAARWLAQWRSRLDARHDARTSTPWWSLFRTDAAHAEAPRLVWADIGKQLRTRVLAAGDPTVPLNSCYVMRTPALEDALALHTLLESPLVAAWLNAIAEPARGGFRRFLGWTVAVLPLPPDWINARTALADISRYTASGNTLSTDDHISATADAYGVSVASMQPLLDWNVR